MSHSISDCNGTATGKAWFDDVRLEEVNDISAYIPPETVKWFGPAFRYTDKGWINVHIEGKPYERGYQYGTLLAPEIVAYMDKLAVRQNGDNARAGWNDLRTMTDALMLRQYDPEYLEEMQGIADGAAAAGAKIHGRTVNLLDIVTINSAVDLGQLGSALDRNRPSALAAGASGRTRRKRAPSERLHKCSSFLANGTALAGRQDRVRTALHVERVHRRALGRDLRCAAGERAPARLSDLPRRHPLRMRISTSTTPAS